jgi:hypothetical protein
MGQMGAHMQGFHGGSIAKHAAKTAKTVKGWEKHLRGVSEAARTVDIRIPGVDLDNPPSVNPPGGRGGARPMTTGAQAKLMQTRSAGEHKRKKMRRMLGLGY